LLKVILLIVSTKKPVFSFLDVRDHQRWHQKSSNFQPLLLARFAIPYCVSLFAVILLCATGIKAQDVHYAQVQDMNVWYNPALKTNKSALLHANFRSVKYRDITAYTSKAATVELPITIDKGQTDSDIGGFTDLAAGINANSSSDGSLNVSTAMLALSYALPLNNDHTYLAAGFQGTYTFSRLTYNGFNSFPAQLDPYGPISSAASADPGGSGYTYEYFAANAGIAAFHTGEKRQWYIGGSVRHLNRPLTDPTQPDSYRLPMNLGIQGSYTSFFTDVDAVGGYGYFSWQGGVHEHVIGGQYQRNLGDSARSTAYINMGYRVGDALIPGFGFRTGSNRFAFAYEFNITRKVSGNYNRRAFEFSYALDF
jgi:type IX secretion system PorP/SprF family membrane protein